MTSCAHTGAHTTNIVTETRNTTTKHHHNHNTNRGETNELLYSEPCTSHVECYRQIILYWARLILVERHRPGSSQSSMPQVQLPCFEERVSVARQHFEQKGYRVHSGLQFGCELVLYADDPDNVHSDFCVHVVSESCMNWMTIQTLARSMSTLHKQLIVVDILPSFEGEDGALAYFKDKDDGYSPVYYKVDEMAIASGHAPFKHKKEVARVGGQVKKKGKMK